VFELLAVGFAGFVALAVIGALLGVASLVVWLVLLPFRLVGFVFKMLGALLFLPFLLLGGGLIAAVVGLPLLFVVLLPLAPLVLLIAGIWWLAKRSFGHTAPTT